MITLSAVSPIGRVIRVNGVNSVSRGGPPFCLGILRPTPVSRLLGRLLDPVEAAARLDQSSGRELGHHVTHGIGRLVKRLGDLLRAHRSALTEQIDDLALVGCDQGLAMGSSRLILRRVSNQQPGPPVIIDPD